MKLNYCTAGIDYGEAMQIMKKTNDLWPRFEEAANFLEALEADLKCQMFILPCAGMNNNRARFDFLTGITALYMAGVRKGMQQERAKQRAKQL